MLSARICLVLAAMIAGGGCIQAKLVEGRPIAREHIAQLEVGVTTRQQVLDWFGAPQSYTDLDVLHRLIEESGGTAPEVLEAPYADILVFQLSEARIEGLVLIVWSEIDVKVSTDRLIVFFDKEDRVLAWGLAEEIEPEDGDEGK